MYIWHHASYSFTTPWLGTWNTSRLRSAIKGTQMASESHKASDTGLGGGEEGGGRLTVWILSKVSESWWPLKSCVVVVAENRPKGLVEIYDSGAMLWNTVYKNGRSPLVNWGIQEKPRFLQCSGDSRLQKSWKLKSDCGALDDLSTFVTQLAVGGILLSWILIVKNSISFKLSVNYYYPFYLWTLAVSAYDHGVVLCSWLTIWWLVWRTSSAEPATTHWKTGELVWIFRKMVKGGILCFLM